MAMPLTFRIFGWLGSFCFLLGRRAFAFAASPALAVASRFTFSAARFFFGGLFVAFASVIRNVKAASLKDQSCPGADHSAHFALAPFFHPAFFPRAGL